MRKYGEGGPWDFSDWGRPIARSLALYLKDSPVSVIQVTNFHFILTLFCAWLILQGQIVPASILLVVKGVVDAIDGGRGHVRAWNDFEVGTCTFHSSNLRCVVSILVVQSLLTSSTNSGLRRYDQPSGRADVPQSIPLGEAKKRRAFTSSIPAPIFLAG